MVAVAAVSPAKGFRVVQRLRAGARIPRTGRNEISPGRKQKHLPPSTRHDSIQVICSSLLQFNSNYSVTCCDRFQPCTSSSPSPPQSPVIREENRNYFGILNQESLSGPVRDEEELRRGNNQQIAHRGLETGEKNYGIFFVVALTGDAF